MSIHKTLPVIAHPDVIIFLQGYSQSGLGERVWKCIHKLQQQQFDGGLRRKNLKGIRKKVWEARVTKAVRLIYTYTKSIEPETEEAKTYVAVQDICLDHDDVSRQVKARKRTPDATWLDAEEIEVIGSLEKDRASLTPEEQSAIKEAEAEELQIPEEVVDELVGNIQWRVVESEKQWQEAITQQDADLPLKLTPEEYELVNHYGNLLLSGNAGTGKTTVSLYRLLKSLETLPEGKRLYVAYNPVLVKQAKQQFNRLVGTQISEVEDLFEFKTIRNLCLEILEEAGKTYLETDEVNYERFNQLYRRSERKKYPPALVWDEIRSIVKGSYLETNKKLLPKQDYEKLGKKRSSIIPKNERYVIYKLAEWYQKNLDKEQYFDEIDLARNVIQSLKHGQGDKYQLIICDEVQDLTEIQLHLLMQLLSPNGQIFFAGDLNQMISPSGFRWEDLKTRLFKGNRQAEQKTLYFNFRSVGSLTRLANQVLKLKSRLLNEKSKESNQTVSSYGEWARLINAPLSNLQPTLKQLYPEDAILVRTEAEKEKLSDEFQSSFVFTIEEAKGLEFDTVFLVEFFQPHSSLWQKAFKGKPALKDKEIPQLRLELNLLYVAITRARRILNIWENQLSTIWTQEEVQIFTEQISSESVREVRVEPTAEMWKERGLYYVEAKFYRQAIECFKFSGDTKLQRQTEAKLLLQERKESEAIKIFLELGEHGQAAQLLQKQKQWEKAAEQYELAGMPKKAAECKASTRNHKQLTQLFEKQKQWDKAAEQYELVGMPEKAAECQAKKFVEAKQWDKAAEQYELVGMPEKAAECQAKKFVEAKQWDKAAEQYELVGMPEKAAECRTKISQKISYSEALNQETLVSEDNEDSYKYETSYQSKFNKNKPQKTKIDSEQEQKQSNKVNDINFITSCNHIIDLLDFSQGRERLIASTIIDRYGMDGVIGKNMKKYNLFETAVQAKRMSDYKKSIFYYDSFFNESNIGKSWFQTYYGVAKTLAVAGDYSRALTAIKIAMELASLTGYINADYIYTEHYKNILALKEGKSRSNYLTRIKG